MRKSDITTPIIDKCKELAKYWRMEIYEGCWVKASNGAIATVIYKERDPCTADLLGYYIFDGAAMWYDLAPLEDIIPIPSISDVLEKLKELGWRNYQFSIAENGRIEMHIIHVPFTFKKEDEIIVQGTPLEALLSALIKVMKEIKDE